MAFSASTTSGFAFEFPAPARLDKFLEFDERNVLKKVGSVSAKIAKEYATSEFEKYCIVQDKLFESYFDKEE